MEFINENSQLTISWLEQITGYKPLDIRMENKWVVLVLPHCTLRFKQA